MRGTIRCLVFAALILNLACGGGSDDGGEDVPSRSDTLAEDGVGADATDAAAEDTPAALDTEQDTTEPGCTMAVQGDMPEPATAPRKFALSMYHFNLQYVAGGTEGMTGRPEVDFSNDDLEDRIIEESFEPLLDLL